MPEAIDVIDRLTDDEEVNVDFDEISQMVEDEAEEMRENQTSSIPDEELEYYAAIAVQNELKNLGQSQYTFGGGEVEEVPILSLGFNRRDGDYFVTTQDALIAGAVINPEGKDPGVCVIVLDEAHGVDMDYAGDCFESLNTVRGHLSIREVGERDDEPHIKKGGFPTYVGESAEDSKFEVVSPDEVGEDDPISELPTDREEKREMINNTFFGEDETFNLQTVTDSVAQNNDRGYPAAFGVDMYRIRAKVQDSVVFESGNGFLTVTDDTIYGKEDIDPELINDRMRTPGLQVRISEEFVYGEGSLLDIYGSIQQNDDGQYQLNALGVIPIVEEEHEGGRVGSSDSDREDNFEEDEI